MDAEEAAAGEGAGEDEAGSGGASTSGSSSSSGGEEPEEEEEKIQCSICEEHLPAHKFPCYNNGQVKGRRCKEDVRAEQSLRNYYKQTWATRFEEKWKELQKDRKRKQREVTDFRHKCPGSGIAGKKRIKMTQGLLAEKNWVDNVDTHQTIEVPMTWEQWRDFAATTDGGAHTTQQAGHDPHEGCMGGGSI